MHSTSAQRAFSCSPNAWRPVRPNRLPPGPSSNIRGRLKPPESGCTITLEPPTWHASASIRRPERLLRPCIQIGGGPPVGMRELRSASTNQHTVFFFFGCYAATLLALQLHQERTQVMCNNKEARKRLAEALLQWTLDTLMLL